MRRLVVGTTRRVLSAVAKSRPSELQVAMLPDADAFVVAFCGSGTGHMMQALTLCRLLQARGG